MDPNVIKGEEIERTISHNLGQILFEVLHLHADNVIQIDAETGRELNARNLLEEAENLAKYLIENGVSQGDTVAIISENRLEFCIVTVSAFFVGATLAPMNPEYTAGELNHVMAFSKPKIIFASKKAIPSLMKCIKDHPYVKSVIIFDKHEEKSLFLNFKDVVTAHSEKAKNDKFTVPNYNSKITTATILCSSGTSGVPKGVETTQENIIACMEIFRKLISRENVEENEDKTDTIVGVAPFFHSFGFFTMFFHLLRGKRMIVLGKFRLNLFLGSIVKYKIRSLVVPPSLLVSILKEEIVKKYNLSSLKEIYVGSAALGEETEIELKKRFNIKHAGQSFGMTETTWVVLSNPFGKAKVGSVGKVCPGMMAKIIDENGLSLGAYKNGELCLKGPMIMKGYAGDIESTRNCIDQNNWLHTGDVAYYDDDYYFFIVDRIKELIKYKGFQVSPSELENLLLAHPAVVDAAVVGKPDEYAGELPTAFVVKKPGAVLSVRDVQNFISENASPQKKLRGGVFFIQEIPRNSNGKVLRRILKATIGKNKLVHKL